MGIAEVIALMKEYGIFQFYLPFMIMFGILYGLLIKSKVFGDPAQPTPRKISLLISFFASLFIMIYTPAIQLSVFLATLFGTTFVVILSLIVFLAILYIIMAAAYPKAEWDWSKYAFLFFIGAIILAIGVYISSGGTALFPGIVWAPHPGVIPVLPPLTAQDIAIIVVAVLTAMVIWLMVRVPKG